jgi:beta-galactosidase
LVFFFLVGCFCFFCGGGGGGGGGGAAPPPAAVDRVVARLVEEARLPRTAEADPGVEAVRRVGDGSSYLFLLNHTDADRKATASGTDLLTGAEVGPVTTVPAGGVRVVRER